MQYRKYRTYLNDAISVSRLWENEGEVNEMTTTESRAEFRQERRELPPPDTAFLSGLLQMLAAVYCRAQYPEPKPEPRKEEST